MKADVHGMDCVRWVVVHRDVVMGRRARAVARGSRWQPWIARGDRATAKASDLRDVWKRLLANVEPVGSHGL